MFFSFATITWWIKMYINRIRDWFFIFEGDDSLCTVNDILWLCKPRYIEIFFAYIIGVINKSSLFLFSSHFMIISSTLLSSASITNKRVRVKTGNNIAAHTRRCKLLFIFFRQLHQRIFCNEFIKDGEDDCRKCWLKMNRCACATTTKWRHRWSDVFFKFVEDRMKLWSYWVKAH